MQGDAYVKRVRDCIAEHRDIVQVYKSGMGGLLIACPKHNRKWYVWGAPEIVRTVEHSL